MLLNTEEVNVDVEFSFSFIVTIQILQKLLIKNMSKIVLYLKKINTMSIFLKQVCLLHNSQLKNVQLKIVMFFMNWGAILLMSLIILLEPFGIQGL